MATVVIYARNGREALALGPDGYALAALKARLTASGFRLVARPAGSLSLRSWAARDTPAPAFKLAERLLQQEPERTDDADA